ncbi:MAG: hypothetical protein HY266_10785 [Deltaproteobacteria bacterium]|nr:hypothetical protein [Deltaproteobacteria bacterium]
MPYYGITKSMTMRYFKPIIATAVIFLIFSVLKRDANAIPVFARKYKTSCMTCHIAFPKLNAFGDAFRRNGYQIPGSNAGYVKEKPVSLGAPGWKEAWPEGVWPGEIPSVPPLSLSGNFLYRYNADSKVKDDFIFPNFVALLSAGTLGEDISFFGSLSFINAGAEFGGVGELFLKFNNLLSDRLPDRLLNVTVGQFEPAAVPIRGDNNLTSTPYLMNTFTVGKDNFRFSAQRGVEINGIIQSRLEYAAGVVNGNGAGKIDSSANSADNNTTKDAYLRIGYKLGGIGLDGAGITAKDTLPETGKETSFYIGAIGYSGSNKVAVSTPTGDDNFYRYGLAYNFNYESVNLYGAIIQGYHDNPRGDFKGTSVISYFSQADVAFYPWLIGIVRYGAADIDYEGKKDEAIISLAALMRANIKLTLEGALHTTGGESDIWLVKLAFAL